ncbi:PREDICTED: uncharacterized protein LOC109183346 [Ipomoea nil]|uniref:uncharacterized protein LOC109183346 n=1 Tax=Ipomoea nil TaxID=35883 RepID=UPI000900A067|nr:PREDICTED: uncharacterized protein LOC109183346 [Ipomoea nil]
MDRAARYADAEAAKKRKKEQEEGRGRKDKAPLEECKAPQPHRHEYAKGPRLNPTRYLTPLTQPVGTILAHAEGQGIVMFLKEECMKISSRGDPNKYCRFHRQKGHDTDECILLKRQIEELIQMGYLGQFIKKPGQAQGQKKGNVWRKGGWSGPRHLVRGTTTTAPRRRKRRRRTPSPRRSVSFTLSLGGPEGGDSPVERKRWARSFYVGEVTRAPHEKKPKREPITFTDADLPDGPLPHRDALVVKLDINNVVVHRVLVDTGSSVNVMYYDTFTQLGLSRNQLEQVRTPPIRVHGRFNSDVGVDQSGGRDRRPTSY